MKKVVAVVGPTAVGKTYVSVALAKIFDGEVINCDSTQVFRTMDIATAKVTPEEMGGIRHHLFDIRDIDEEYTVFDYQNDGRRVIDEITGRGHLPIVVGGTGLYAKALLYDYRFENTDNSKTYDELSDAEVYEKLLALDPETDIDKNNRSRVVKALNYCISTGKPYSAKEKTDKLLYDARIIGLTCDRSLLYERIDMRVDKMLEAGLLKEAKMIYDSGIRSRAVMTPIGYKELFPYFDHEASLTECVEIIKKKSRNYAKRQYTWFNNQMNTSWFEVDPNNPGDAVKKIETYIKSENLLF